MSFIEKRVVTTETFDGSNNLVHREVVTDEFERIDKEDYECAEHDGCCCPSCPITDCDECEDLGACFGDPMGECMCSSCINADTCADRCEVGIIADETANPCTECGCTGGCGGCEVDAIKKAIAGAAEPLKEEQSEEPKLVVISGTELSELKALIKHLGLRK